MQERNNAWKFECFPSITNKNIECLVIRTIKHNSLHKIYYINVIGAKVVMHFDSPTEVLRLYVKT